MIATIVEKGKISIYLILINICILSAAFMAFGQASRSRSSEDQLRELREQKTKEAIIEQKIKNQSETVDFGKESSDLQRLLNSAKANENLAKIRKERKRINALRAPYTEDLVKYAEFLKQTKTGLFRLFPDLGCENKNIVRVDGDCENAVFFSSAYSFRQKNYDETNFLDVRLKDGSLIADGFLSQEILVSLGDVPLESLSLADNRIKFLSEFEPKRKIQEAKKQFVEISQIIESDGYKYGKSVKAELNTTYAARIVAYRNDAKKNDALSYDSMSSDEEKFWQLENDKRIDLTVAFRVIRKEQNGSLTILWKVLNRQESPKIIFEKNEKLSDIKP